MKNVLFIVFISITMSCVNKEEVTSKKDLNISIIASANSWVVNNPIETKNIISDNGITNWTNENDVIRTYFKINSSGNLNLGLKAKVINGKSKIKVTFNNVSKIIKLNSNTIFENVFVDSFNVKDTGYVYVDIQGISKTSEEFAQIEAILIGGETTKEEVIYIKDDIYWGRRGPSVHLSYEVPNEASDIVYFYNEMSIPTGNDVIGSYFMANGFAEGYFGIQVNSNTERRILFSVWSPFKTDDPNSIPDNQKIILLSKGENVITGEFGNEGSGGQSRKIFNWKPDTTYKFLLKGAPSENNSTDYTAYFYAPEIGKWELIASFRRPITNTYLTKPHSFLENFIPEMGNEVRKVNYTNQWVYDTSKKWYELNTAKFTADATAKKKSRLDYAGGSDKNNFYLKNCGFFSVNTSINTIVNRTKTGAIPIVNFEELPK